jgi:hypothetical protein
MYVHVCMYVLTMTGRSQTGFYGIIERLLPSKNAHLYMKCKHLISFVHVVHYFTYIRAVQLYLVVKIPASWLHRFI